MTKRTQHDLIQGSPEWHQFRLEHHGASEAAAMLGLSKQTKRSELLRLKHSGVAKEFSDFVQAILENGHAVEALARPIVEEMIGDELYPVTCSYGALSASCDGLTMDGATACEHKQWSEALAAAIRAGELPEEHQPQAQQIMHVTGAARLIFVCSDGTRERMVHIEVRPDPVWVSRIEAGWKQFDADVCAYAPQEVLPPVTAAPVMALPAVFVKVDGALTIIDNLAIFGAKLNQFIEAIDKEPKDDQAFANAEASIKVLETAEAALESAEAHALSQTSGIDEMRRTVALYRDTSRTTRLLLTRLVKERKEQIRGELVQSGRDRFAAHVAALNARLGKPYMPAIPADFGGVIKGKKTIANLKDAVDVELSRAKIAASEAADRIQINLTTLRELAAGYEHLFADTATIVLKANDDLTALVQNRIAAHKAVEEKRLEAERERIRAEETAKLEEKAKADALAAAPPAVTPAAGGAVTPPPPAAVRVKKTPPAPPIAEMVAVIARHYGVSESVAAGWIAPFQAVE